jgi:hypothetical protein
MFCLLHHLNQDLVHLNQIYIQYPMFEVNLGMILNKIKHQIQSIEIMYGVYRDDQIFV